MVFSIAFPLIALGLASLGIGSLVLALLRRSLPPLGIVMYGATAYCVGQAVIAISFLGLGLVGVFTQQAILCVLLAGVAAGAVAVWRSAPLLRAAKVEGGQLWAELGPGWKLLALLSSMVYLLGFATLGGWLEGDPIAFYFALPKMVAHTHQLGPLPGYEGFSPVGVYAEMLVAGLMSLGMPDVSPRIFFWLDHFPALLLLFGLARKAGLGARGSLLAVIVPLTSSAAVLLWGNAKTDLVAVGPAVCCCLLALSTWKMPSRAVSVLLIGFLCGYASVLKLSYLLPLVPAVALLLVWQELFAMGKALREGKLAEAFGLLGRQAWLGMLFVAGFSGALGPHIYKNVSQLGTVFGANPLADSWFAPATVRRLILTYPVALVFGRYWAQLGNLSPLVLAFAPMLLFMKRTRRLAESPLAALSIATTLGVVLWIALMPSIFMPRYLLATLLMLGVPVAAGAEAFMRRSRHCARLVFLATAVVLVTAPVHVYSWSKYINLSKTLTYLSTPGQEILAAGPMESYLLAHQAINDAAGTDDRVILFTYYRFWLRPDLIRHASSLAEYARVLSAKDSPWKQMREDGYRFALVDKAIIPASEKIFAQKPDDVQLKELFVGGSLASYEIIWPDAPAPGAAAPAPRGISVDGGPEK